MAKKWKSLAYEKSQSEEAANLNNNNNHYHHVPKKLKFCHAHIDSEQNNNNTTTVANNNNSSSSSVIIKGKKVGRDCTWGPASPTEGTTAPSPPPAPAWLPAPTAGKVTVLFNGKSSFSLPFSIVSFCL